MESTHTVADTHRLVARAAAVVGLLGIALIHLLDLPAKIHETPYLGGAYLALITGALLATAMLLRHDDRRAWIASLTLALATLAGYAINRTVGMPGATEDVGNWLEPLGLASLFVEAVTAGVSAYALVDKRR